jgi:hypothetical protein
LLIAILVVLCLMCGALVILFAMMAELWSRVAPLAGINRASADTEPLNGARIGAVDIDWPSELAHVPGLPRAALIVLSTSCATCRDVSAQLTAGGVAGATSMNNLSVVMSCPRRETGEEFVRRYSLATYPHLVDAGGAWVSRELGVQSSPSALLFRAGRLEKAFTFTSMAALTASMSETGAAEPKAETLKTSAVRD